MKYSPIPMKMKPTVKKVYMTDVIPVTIRKSKELNIRDSPKTTKNMFLWGDFRNRNKTPKEDVIRKLLANKRNWLICPAQAISAYGPIKFPSINIAFPSWQPRKLPAITCPISCIDMSEKNIKKFTNNMFKNLCFKSNSPFKVY